jgi:hypothetical protein
MQWAHQTGRDSSPPPQLVTRGELLAIRLTADSKGGHGGVGHPDPLTAVVRRHRAGLRGRPGRFDDGEHRSVVWFPLVEDLAQRGGQRPSVDSTAWAYSRRVMAGLA